MNRILRRYASRCVAIGLVVAVLTGGVLAERARGGNPQGTVFTTDQGDLYVDHVRDCDLVDGAGNPLRGRS